MDAKASSSSSNIQHPRTVPSGWAAFDKMHRQKQGIECETDDDPFPPITSTKVPRRPRAATYCQKSKTFSLVKQSENAGKSHGYCDDQRKTNDNNMVGISYAGPIGKLNGLHDWADEGLISDISAAGSNDEHASVLEAMPMSSLDNNEEDFLNAITGPKGHLAGTKQLTLKHSFVAPVQPEWEENDVYFTHRRDAIKMQRSAAKHSKAAAYAFIKGDHSSGHQLSAQAKEERAAAEVLNSKAAREIVRIRNDPSNIWKLDLHGLHASESVNVLKARLNKIESMQMKMPWTNFSDKSKFTNGAFLSRPNIAKNASANCSIQALFRPRWMALQVITGTGNHSRGEAALPTAVRGFLIENGYRFDDARPGVLAVLPKFRLK